MCFKELIVMDTTSFLKGVVIWYAGRTLTYRGGLIGHVRMDNVTCYWPVLSEGTVNILVLAHNLSTKIFGLRW